MYAHDVAPSVRIGFEGNTLCVFRYIVPIPNFHGHWEEVAKFITEESWEQGSFSKMIQSEYYKDMIMWHWIDAHETC